MDGWFFKTNLVCSPPSENIDNGWMMMVMMMMMIKTTTMVVVVVVVALVVVVMMMMITIMNDDDDDDSSFLSRVLMKMETNGIPYLRFILELAEACSFAHIDSALT